MWVRIVRELGVLLELETYLYLLLQVFVDIFTFHLDDAWSLLIDSLEKYILF